MSSWLGRKKHSFVRRDTGILALDGTGANLFPSFTPAPSPHPLRIDRSRHFGLQRKGEGLQFDLGEKN